MKKQPGKRKMENSRTINGKPFGVVVEELRAPFPESAVKDNQSGYPYIPIEEYRKRLDEVVGVLNYDYRLSKAEWVTIGDKEHMSCLGTLVIRDDEGKVVTVKMATGDADVITKNSTGAAVKTGNDAKTADKDAFKSCCRMLGIGDAQLREHRKGKNGSGSRGGASGKGPQNTSSDAKEEEIRVVVRGAFSSLGGGKGYKAPAVLKETGEQVALILWKEGIDAVKEYMPLADFLEKYKSKEFSVVATRNTFTMKNGRKEEQIIMLRPVA